MAEGAAALLRCNGCWSDVDCKEHSVVTACGHLYCLNCCQTIMESDDQTCPICNQLVQKSNVKATHALAAAPDLALALAGQSPAVILEVAHMGIHFYNRQQALYAEYAQAQSARKIAKTQDQCRKKLQEVHNGYLAAKRKYQEVLAQKHALAADNKELQDKYNQKAMQDKKLKENFSLLQQENDALRRQLAALQKAAGGGMALCMPPAFGAGAGGGGGRASRMGVLGMDADPMIRQPATVLAPRAIQPDPSPLASMMGTGQAGGGYGGGGGSRGGYGFDTPENQQVMRQLHTSGGNGSGARMLAGMGGGGLGGMGGGMGRQGGMNNDKRAALGFNAPPNSMQTM